MKRKVADPKVLEVNNKELKELMEICKTDRTKENTAKLLRAVDFARFLVPARLPEDVDPKIRMLMQQNKPIPKGQEPAVHPVLLKNNKGENFVPLFTSASEFPKDAKMEVILNLGSEQLMDILQLKDVNGFLVNPESDKMVLNEQFMNALDNVHKNVQKKKEMKMSPEQFERFARNNAERGIIPQAAHNTTKEFLERLEAEQGAFICELYQKPFGNNIPNPYSASQFDIMMMNISETRMVVSIDLPAPKAAGECYGIYLVVDPTVNKMKYFMFELADDGSGKKLSEVTDQGLYRRFSIGPGDSSELFFLLDYLDKEEKEEK